MKTDILIAYPGKYHILHLVSGCTKSGHQKGVLAVLSTEGLHSKATTQGPGSSRTSESGLGNSWQGCSQDLILEVGVGPVKELRAMGHLQGITEEELIDGNATKLPFGMHEFDLVCEFGVLHHIKEPNIAVSEMLRIAKTAIFLSDSNNFGQVSPMVRFVKQFANALSLWKVVDLIKTKGKGYTISEGDGLGYSYSVFNNYAQIREQCKSIHLLDTKDGRAH